MADQLTNAMARPANKAVDDYKLDQICVREDGVLVHANAVIIKNSGGSLLPYDGDVNAPLEDRLLFFRGFRKHVGGSVTELVEQNRLDITRMSLADLKEYALDEYGLNLSDKKIDRAQALMAVIAAREEQERGKNGQQQASGISAQK